MGWQDAPLVEDEQESSTGQAWATAPEVDSPGAQAAPMPSMGEVALNAVPKGVANFLNTPNLISHLLLKGVASIPGMDSMPEVKKFLEEGAEKFGRNGPMHMMETAGLVDPAKNPQTAYRRSLIQQSSRQSVGRPWAAELPGQQWGP